MIQFRRNPPLTYLFVATNEDGSQRYTEEYVITYELPAAQEEAIRRFGARGLLVTSFGPLTSRPGQVIQELRSRPIGRVDVKPVGGWYEAFAPKALTERERALVQRANALAPRILQEIAQWWRDPDVGPWMGAFLAEEGLNPLYAGDELTEEDWQDAPLQPDEFLASASGLPRFAVAELIDTGSQAEACGGIVPDQIAKVIIREILLSYFQDSSGRKPRIVLVSKELAAGFIQKHHKKLPYLNPLGLLYTMGVRVGTKLVAVATVNTPSGPFNREGCPKQGVVELTRIASDGSTLGASSMLAARTLDLLPISGRMGVRGCLFVTYSLTSEAGTTYLALVDKGLRPTARRSGAAPSGARKGATQKSLSLEPKITWEAGPAAKPPNWEALAGLVPAERILGAQRAFAAWEARQRKKR